MKIEFISDIACPWCAVGLNALERALEKIGDDIPIEFHVEPFELNPQMPPEGEDAVEHLSRKYRIGPEQIAATRRTLHERGREVGFTFGDRPHIWNTFDGHRLLHWAGTVDPAKQRALKHALLTAYHGRGENPGAREVLLAAAADAGLDATEAAAVVDDTDRYAAEVRAREHHWQQLGIHSVPATVIDGTQLVSGGQPAEVFERVLRQIAAENPTP